MSDEEQQLKEQILSDHPLAGCSDHVSVDVNGSISDRSNITSAHTRPGAKTEQRKLKFTVPRMTKLSSQWSDVKYSSPFRVIGNLPWRVLLDSVEIEDENYLRVSIDCNSDCDSHLWSCDADIKIQLLSSVSEQNPYTEDHSHKFKYGAPSLILKTFIQCDKLMDPKNGYVNVDEANMEVDVTIRQIIGYRGYSKYDFSVNSPGSNSEVILVVDGQRLHVCKHYLSVHSPVFHAMFFSEFIERDKNEIILEDLKLDEFLEMLHVIYPTHNPVTKNTVEFLMKLGDRFEVPFVTEECERFLIATKDISVSKKLIYSNQYCLAKLQDVCMKTISDYDALKALKRQEEYENFGSETKVALLERLFKVVK